MADGCLNKQGPLGFIIPVSIGFRFSGYYEHINVEIFHGFPPCTSELHLIIKTQSRFECRQTLSGEAAQLSVQYSIKM